MSYVSIIVKVLSFSGSCHVEFKKCPCGPLEFSGQDPLSCSLVYSGFLAQIQIGPLLRKYIINSRRVAELCTCSYLHIP